MHLFRHHRRGKNIKGQIIINWFRKAGFNLKCMKLQNVNVKTAENVQSRFGVELETYVKIDENLKTENTYHIHSKKLLYKSIKKEMKSIVKMTKMLTVKGVSS